jgi:hypothetical protein
VEAGDLWRLKKSPTFSPLVGPKSAFKVRCQELSPTCTPQSPACNPFLGASHSHSIQYPIHSMGQYNSKGECLGERSTDVVKEALLKLNTSHTLTEHRALLTTLEKAAAARAVRALLPGAGSFRVGITAFTPDDGITDIEEEDWGRVRAQRWNAYCKGLALGGMRVVLVVKPASISFKDREAAVNKARFAEALTICELADYAATM